MSFLLNVPKWLLVFVPLLPTNLKTNLNEKLSGLEKLNSLSLATISDPRFKQAGFTNQSNDKAAVERLTREFASLSDGSAEDVPLETATTSASAGEENYYL